MQPFSFYPFKLKSEPYATPISKPKTEKMPPSSFVRETHVTDSIPIQAREVEFAEPFWGLLLLSSKP
jgi:hypothetical protein